MQLDQLKRREFITLAVSAPTEWSGWNVSNVARLFSPAAPTISLTFCFRAYFRQSCSSYAPWHYQQPVVRRTSKTSVLRL
jgi:hypothetical protein